MIFVMVVIVMMVMMMVVGGGMRGKTNTGSEIALKRKPSSTLAVSLGGNSEIKPPSNTLFDFYRIRG